MGDFDLTPNPLEHDLTFRDSSAALVPDLITDENAKVPNLGMSRPPRSLSLFNVPVIVGTTGAATYIKVTRPTLLIPNISIFPQSPGSHTFWDIVYAPVDPPFKAFYQSVTLAQTVGFRLPGGCIWLWAPGVWWIFVSSSNPGNLAFQQIPCDNPDVARYLINESSNNGSFEIALAAATVTEVITGPDMVRTTHLRINNSGAQPALYTFGDNEVPDANTGFLLNAGETHVYTGQEIPMARLRAFSTAGTNLHIYQVLRFG